MARTFIAILLALVVAGALPACAPQPSATSTQPQPDSPGQGAATVLGDATMVVGLAPSEKRAIIAEDFPAEVPAPQGDYSDVVAQAGNAWDYQVEVDAAAADLMRWYLEAYLGRGWTAVEEGRLSDGGEAGTFAVLRKGAAQTRVRVYGTAQARPARAAVTIGVGAPVLETQ